MKPLPPSRYAPSGRVAAPSRETMGPVARAMYDRSLELFGGEGGPRMPLLHTPDIADAWGRIGLAIITSPLPARYRELAIITVAAFWQAEMEWLMHASEALDQGIDPVAIEAIRLGDAPVFTEEGDTTIYRYVDELQREHRVSDEVYVAARVLLGDAGLVALTVAIGHFTNVAMTLRAHALSIPDDCAKAFE
ncbi:MAG: carboxymuconolactone decarboxylase family protein [Pseudomonadota bacterium]